MAKNLLGGQSSEWALLRRHPCEATAGQLFGVQIAGAHVDMMTRVAELLEDHTSLDFVDINMGCPIDVVCNKGMGCGMAERPARMEEIIRGMSSTLSVPLTVKMRTAHSSEERRRPLFWQPFSAVTEPPPGLLVPLSGILASRRRKPRKNEKTRGKNGRYMA